MTRLLAAAFAGLILASDSASGPTPARPKPDNPSCPYPPEARAALVTGEVQFQAVVLPDGSVGSVTIEKAPEQDLGFSDSVRSTVSQWRFEPATSQGQPLSSTYRDVIPFDLFLSPDRARVFPVASSEALAALERVFEHYGLRLKSRDIEQGVLITTSKRFSKLGGSGPDPRRIVDRSHAEAFEVYAFVSQDIEPAHVHLDARVDLRSGDRRTQVISRGPVEAWLLDALAAELGKEGRPVPYGEEGLSRLRRDFGLPSPACTPGKIAFPVLIPSSKVRPIYPDEARQRGDDAKVQVRARILRDGTVLPDDVSALGSADPQFKTAAVAAVRLWRYHPSRQGTCPVPTYMTVSVSFDLIPSF